MGGSLRVRCACGWEVIGDEPEVVEATIEHGRRLHNMVPTREEVLAMVIEDPIESDEGGAASPGVG